MTTTQRTLRGFSLVEVVLALGVAAFCLVAIFGLLPVGVNTNQTSIEQTVAANLASLIVADLQAIPKIPALPGPTPTPGPISPRFKVPAPPIPGSTATTTAFFLREDGTATDTPGLDANPTLNPRYRATITYVVPPLVAPATQSYLAVSARILITWPAMADPSASAVPRNFSGSLEVSSALDRN